MTTNFLISVVVELDPNEYDADDVGYHRQRIKQLVEAQCPGAAVNVRAGRYVWCDEANHSVRV